MFLKKISLLIIFSIFLFNAQAQDTTKSAVPVVPPVTETPKAAVVADTIKPIAPVVSTVIKADTVKAPVDSLPKLAVDTLRPIKTDSLKVATMKADTAKVKPLAAAAPPPVAIAPVEKTKISLKTGWGISIKAGTLGFGGEIVKELGPKFSVRLGGNYFPYEYKGIELPIPVFGDGKAKLDLKLQLLTFTLLADWYIVKSIHLTGGLAYNLNKFEIKGAPGEDVAVGSFVLTPDDAGSVTMKFISPKIAPYLGMGFGRAISHKRRISFNTDLGVLFTGGPKVEEFSSTGLVVAEPNGQDENAKKIEENMNWLNIFPVISFQLTYKFIK